MKLRQLRCRRYFLSAPSNLRVYLFDIDGTLIRSLGTGRRALMKALREVTGNEIELADLDLAGRTDFYILKRILERHAGGYTAEKYQELLFRYLQNLEESVSQSPPEVLPGVELLLQELSQESNAMLGLLTGNVETGARLKLGPLFEYFSFGVYGEFAEHRDTLGIQAREIFERHSGLRASELVVIGDTPHDISCARAGGAKMIAVATGQFARHELSAADAILNTLEEWRHLRIFD